jgi:hypothetical protein
MTVVEIVGTRYCPALGPWLIPRAWLLLPALNRMPMLGAG